LWLYLGSSYFDHSFSKELSVVEVNIRIHKVLDHVANPNPEVGPTPLREGVASTKVSLFRSVLVAYTILLFHHSHGLVQGLGGGHSASWGIILPEDC
jgi:hypothetical protein